MKDDLWFKQFATSKECGFMRNHPIVYFCAEYALNDNLPIYAGGLGVLAGDLVREAAEQEIPLIAVGLFYTEGYLHHELYGEDIAIKSHCKTNPASIGLKPVVDEQNHRITVALPIQDTLVYAQAWLLWIGSVRIYLLDTRIPQNTEDNRQITDQLYTSNTELRFKQEMILGLGGLRLLEALKISPIGYHLNEGHSALLTLEIARYEMQKRNRAFMEVLNITKQHIFFTNHTLVPAGNDNFPPKLVEPLLSGFAKELKVPVSSLVNLGLSEGSSSFSMTLLALRMAEKINAVSRLHAQKARELWKEYSIIPITNGIHIKTWDNIKTKDKIWENHQRNKRKLLEYIRTASQESWDENTLLLGWARRIVGYKRPLALFDNLEQFKQLAISSDRPIRVVISGLSHNNDTEGLVILKHIRKIVTVDLKGIVVYLPEYSRSIAKLLVSGCDVWLNTPVVGSEACGTSGMKAALNGVLPCSTSDGWVAQAELHGVGWLLQSQNLSEAILAILKKDIMPLYYSKDNRGTPGQWVEMMQNARDMIISQFSSTTMLRKYFEEFYLPIIKTHQSPMT